MKKIILIILLLCSISSTFAIVQEITFHNKFEKSLNKTTTISSNKFTGFPVHNFKQMKINYTFIEDRRYREKTYEDIKEDYAKLRRENNLFGQKQKVPTNLYKFKKNYQKTNYEKYKEKLNKNQQHTSNLFIQNNLKFKNSESHFRNNY